MKNLLTAMDHEKQNELKLMIIIPHYMGPPVSLYKSSDWWQQTEVVQ